MGFVKGSTLIGISGLLTIFLACFLVYNVGFGQSNIPIPTKERYLELAEDIARSRNYSKGDYDCRNFSTDLVIALQNEGYDAIVITGWVSTSKYCKVGNETFIGGIPYRTITEDGCLSPHAWVQLNLEGAEIQIEATTGKVIDVKTWENNTIGDQNAI